MLTTQKNIWLLILKIVILLNFAKQNINLVGQKIDCKPVYCFEVKISSICESILRGKT